MTEDSDLSLQITHDRRKLARTRARLSERLLLWRLQERRSTRLKRFALFSIVMVIAFLFSTVFRVERSFAASLHPRRLKFSGVPLSEATNIKNKFPFVFERDVTLSEVDELVRWLMTTGHYSNIEVVERGPDDKRELVLVASILRHIKGITIAGNRLFSNSDIRQTLNIAVDHLTFERKELLAAAEELRKTYERAGYHNARVEIDFKTPTENSVEIFVNVVEGTPLRVSEVTIETDSEELVKRMKRFASSLKQHTLGANTLADFEKSVTDYLQHNRYIIAKISAPSILYNADRTEAKISYSIESPWRYEFFFNGNDFFSDGRMIEHFDLDKFSGTVSTPAPDLAEKIRRMYQSAGFAHVEVTYKEKTLEKDYIRQVNFHIIEGPRVRIKKIEVSGNISQPPSYYGAFIQASSSDLIGDGYYNRKDIEDGEKQLVAELQNQGFLRARVQSERAEFSKDRASVTIHLQIDEGPLTQIRQIKFEGATTFSRNDLLSVLKIKTGAALGLKELEDSIQALKDFYRTRGFLEMRIINENEQDRIVTYNDTNTQATVVFQIQEGPKVVVGSIIIEGNSFTKSNVIDRELTFKVGDTLTPERVDETVFRLQRLGLFSKVEISTLEQGTSESHRTVQIRVGERDPGLFVLGAGVNNDDTTHLSINYHGYLGIAYRNLWGTGRAISLRADADYNSDPTVDYLANRSTISYLEPFIFDSPTRLRINLIRAQQVLGKDTVLGHADILESNTVNLLFERDFNRHLKLTFTGYSYSAQRTFDRQTAATLNKVNIAKVGPLFEFDYRDDAFSPTRGSYSSIDLQYADPLLGSRRGSSEPVQFLKMNVMTTVYSPLTKSHSFVWANSAHFGYLANLSRSADSGVPVQEIFFLGGRTTIRGFDAISERILSQSDLVGKTIDISTFQATSDSYYYLLKSELRFPIWKKSPAGELGGALFYDGGSVIINQPDVQLRRIDPNYQGHDYPLYRHSIGLGIRIATPVGPVSIDYGFKLNRRKDRGDGTREEIGAGHFSIGVF